MRLIVILFLLLMLFIQQPLADRSNKPCTVTEVVAEGVRSDCKGWRPAKGERMFMPAAVSKQLKVGDVFYFVWKEDRWIAEIIPSEGLRA